MKIVPPFAVLFAAIVLFPLAAISQYRVLVTSNTVPDSNILYRGFENTLVIKGWDRGLVVRARHSRIKPAEFPGEYFIITTECCADTLEVTKNHKILHTEIFRVETLPPIRTILGNLRDTSVSKQMIIANGILKFDFSGVIFDYRISIAGFTTAYEKRSGDNIPAQYSLRNRLSEDQIRTIQKLSPGDRIFFKDIRIFNYIGCLRGISDEFYLEVR